MIAMVFKIVIASDKMIAPMVKIKGSMIALERDDCKLRNTDPFLFYNSDFYDIFT